MPVVKLKPTSPGRRAMVKVVTPTLHKGAPVASLIEPKKRGSGRNNLVTSPPVIVVVVTSVITGSSTSAATRTVFPPASSAWNMIRTVAPTWPCCCTQTASVATSWHRVAFRPALN